MGAPTRVHLHNLMSEATGLVLRLPSWMGDILLARPAWVRLRQRLNRPMVALVRRRYAELAGLFPEFDQVLAYPERTGPVRWQWFVRRRARFRDGLWIGVALANSLEAAWELRLLGLPVRFGFRTDGRGLLLTHGLEPRRAGLRWQAEDYLYLVQAALHDHDLVLAPLAPLRVPAAWREDHPMADTPYVAMHTGASKRPRRWPLERFQAVAEALVRRGWSVHLHVDEPGTGAGQGLTLHVQAPLKRLVACLAGARFFVGNDAGPAHLAAALGIPTAVVYGPGHPALHRPVGTGATFLPIHADWPCSPCRQRFFRECEPVAPERPACLDFLQPQDVLAVLEENGWLDQGPTPDVRRHEPAPP